MKQIYMDNYEDTGAVILLAIEDDTIRDQLSKLFKMRFTEVFEAKTPFEAEEILRNNSVTHLICSNELLNNQQLGVKLILQWKEQYASIERTVLYNRTLPNSKYLPAEIDQVLEKNPDLHDLWSAVGLVHYPEGLYLKES